MKAPLLRAPFPWFGGKSRASSLVWAAFGGVANYVEPFAGSLAVLLARPTPARIETVNDLDCYLSNFWRALQAEPDAVAAAADWPVNEADLHARHRWLVKQGDFRERMHTEPDFYDSRIAGWWVWGLCQWIGGGWCAGSNWDDQVNLGRGRETAEEARRPHLMRDRGVHQRKRSLEGSANWRKRPSLGKGERGIQRGQIPNLSGDSGAAGRGVHASGQSNGPLVDWMRQLAARLRKVRVCCGQWNRVLGRSSTEKIGVTGVLLDPPYSAEAGRDPSLYGVESLSVAHDVREWALEHGSNRKLRIALCGYEGEHTMPDSWTCVSWKAAGGYASAAGNHENSLRERIWFSPHCQVGVGQAELFGGAA